MSVYLNTSEVDHFLFNSSCSLIHFNARSMRKHYDDIQNLLSTITKPFPIICITETWLSDADKNLFGFPNYSSEYAHRPSSNHGGAAIYVLSNLAFKRRHDLALNLPNCEAVWVEFDHLLLNIDNKNFILGCIYRSPSTSITDFCNALDNVLESISSENKNVVIVGDMNINLLDTASANFTTYSSCYHSYGFECLITQATRLSRDGGCSLIDHALSNLLVAPEAGILTSDITDHYPIILKTISTPICRSACFHKLVLDKEALIENITKSDWLAVRETNDPQEAFSRFFSLLLHYFHSHSHRKKCKKTIASPQNPWLTDKLLKAMRRRENLYKKTKKQPFNVKLRARYKKYCNNLCAYLKRAKRKYLEQKILECGSNSDKKWKLVNSFLNRNGDRGSITSIIHNGIVHSNPRDIADTFSDFFFSNNLPSDQVLDYEITRLPQSFYLFPTSADEVTAVIRNLKTTSAGLDDISPSHIKLIALSISDILAHVINLIFKKGTFPRELKRARVTPVFKKGDRSLVTNYRPICVLPFLSKVIEKLFEKRLTNYLRKFSILTDFQFGFRTGYSTDLALLYLTEFLKQAIDDGSLAGSVFVDLTKAFDTINHQILFIKLEAMGICGPALLFIRSYLLNRNQTVSISGTYSKQTTTNIGVPQGSILGPLLFLIYINDLPNFIIHCKYLLYADDTTIFSSDNSIDCLINKLSTDLRNILHWCKLNKLQFNPQKTQFILFSSHQRSLVTDPSISIPNHSIHASNDCVYLGVKLDRNLKFHSHILDVKKKLSYGIRILIRSRPFFSRSILLSLYYAFIHSHINYCITTWGTTYNTHLAPLQTVQNKAIKIVTSSSHYTDSKQLFYSYNILTVRDMVKYNLVICLSKHINELFPISIIPSSSLLNTNNTRFAYHKNFILPKARTNYGKQTAHFSSLSIWNSLPSILKVMNPHSFVKELKKLFVNQYNT